MGRIRSIKPEILTDEKTAALCDHDWRLFVSMWVMADDYGNLRASVGFINSQAFWGSGGSPKSSRESLERLASLSLVQLYEVHGQQYAHIVNWDKHQKVDHPGKPLCPGPKDAIPQPCGDSSRDRREIVASTPETLAPDLEMDMDQEVDRTRKGTIARKRAEYSEAFARFWSAYPRKVSKGQAIKAWPGDEHLDAILAALAWQVPTWGDPQYIKHPATWLRARCWEDERPKASAVPRQTNLRIGSVRADGQDHSQIGELEP